MENKLLPYIEQHKLKKAGMSHLNMDSTKIGTHSLPLEEDIGNLRLALFTTVSIADTV